MKMASTRRWSATALALLLAGCAAQVPPRDAVRSAEEVRAAEIAFATSMAQRKFDAFAALVAEDAVFINAGKPLRGKAEILAFWKRFFDKPDAPFAWNPEIVEVSGGGELGYTEGPVSVPGGAVVGRFYSTWKRGVDGRWLVIFDNGYDLCKCPR